MPFQAVAWAWRVPVAEPVERCALLWLANRADDGGVAYAVDLEALASFCACPCAALDAALNRLADAGLISTTDLGDAYWVDLPISWEWVLSGAANSLPLPTKLRAEVVAAADGRCFACGDRDEPHVDHIIPRAKGGTNDRANLQVLCGDCNRRKRDKLGWVQL
ncbi:MAG: endonuclease [Phenylobacterium sp.]|nr:endonuclease [Phenylobacterium sp.]